MSDQYLRQAMLAWAKKHERGVAHQGIVQMLRQIVLLAEETEATEGAELDAEFQAEDARSYWGSD